MARLNLRHTSFRLAVFIALVLSFATAVSAQSWGEFYLHDDSRYWWFRDGERAFEIALPANPTYVVQRNLFGERSLELAVNDNDVYFQIARFAGGEAEVERAREAITSRWQHALTDIKVTENRTIRTNMNLDARFTVIQGRTPDGANAMVRTVLFTTGETSAYLVWTGLASRYTGPWQQAWIEAVNSFTWLR